MSACWGYEKQHQERVDQAMKRKTMLQAAHERTIMLGSMCPHKHHAKVSPLTCCSAKTIFAWHFLRICPCFSLVNCSTGHALLLGALHEMDKPCFEQASSTTLAFGSNTCSASKTCYCKQHLLCQQHLLSSTTVAVCLGGNASAFPAGFCMHFGPDYEHAYDVGEVTLTPL